MAACRLETKGKDDGTRDKTASVCVERKTLERGAPISILVRAASDFDDLYEIGEQIGSGGFGRVYDGIRKADRERVGPKRESAKSHEKRTRDRFFLAGRRQSRLEETRTALVQGELLNRSIIEAKALVIMNRSPTDRCRHHKHLSFACGSSARRRATRTIRPFFSTRIP